jgi:acetyltransferase EpsM
MSKRNIIIGAGGHGKVIADMMLRQGMDVLGFLDDNPALVGLSIFGLPVLGLLDQWKDFEPDGLVAAIGSNAVRRTVVQRLEMTASPPWVTIIHPNAVIAQSVQIGIGTVIMAGAVVNADAKLGNHAIINTGATVDHDCVIGDFAHVAPGAHLAGDVTVGEGVLLGVGCAVIPGCDISENAIIGAGGVVICDIPRNVVAIGVPARWVK